MPATEQSLRVLGRKAGLEAAVIAELWAILAERYGEEHRAYHNLAHVGNMLDHLDSCPSVDSREALAWAIWFHDVVYDPQSSSNEADSAALFRERLGSSLDSTFVEEVERLIMVTDPRGNRPSDHAGQLMADLDLLTLGGAREDYEVYAKAIRREYAFVPPEAYSKGRIEVMTGFLEQDQIYQTLRFAHLEKPARANIEAEIVYLCKAFN